MIQVGSLVKTPYGVAEVMEVREDGIVVARFETAKACSCCVNYWFGYFSVNSVTECGRVRSKKQIRTFDEFLCEHGGMEEEEAFCEEEEGQSRWKRQRSSPFEFSSL